MENVVFINGNRNGYAPNQCLPTMTVRELIDYLSDFDEDSKVFLRHDDGYTYGSINAKDITEREYQVSDYE